MIKGQHLDRDQALVVVQRQVTITSLLQVLGVIPGLGCTEPAGVRWHRAFQLKVALALLKLLQASADPALLFRSELAIFPGMGIESGHPEARSLAEAPAKVLELVEASLQALWR